MAVLIEPSLFYAPEVSELQLPVKRYTAHRSNEQDTTPGYTLLFAHATGMHKEQWEPIITFLLRDDRVREAWSFDWPSHGAGATVNEETLRNREEAMPVSEWAAIMAAFMKTKKFPRSSTVAIGHSNGSTALMITRALPDKLKEGVDATMLLLNKRIAKRRELWSDRKEAITWMSKRSPWQEWDARVLELFIAYALRQTTLDGPEVRVACDKFQEAMAFLDYQPQYDAMGIYQAIASSLPIHIILAENPSELERQLMALIVDTSNGLPRPASVQWVPEAGHLVIQEKPDAVARAIVNILNEETKRPLQMLAATARL